MSQSFTFLEDTAIADMAFEATGDSLSELFSASARALFECMVDTRRLHLKITKQIKLRDSQIDRLLFDWLSELVCIKDAEGMLFGKYIVHVEKKDQWELEAKIIGDRVNQKKQRVRTDVKAVTYHLFDVSQADDGTWKARVVVDT